MEWDAGEIGITALKEENVMKCIFCDADLTTLKNQKYSVFPFCKRPVLSMDHGVDSLKEVLSNLVAQCGDQIVTDKGIITSIEYPK